MLTKSFCISSKRVYMFFTDLHRDLFCLSFKIFSASNIKSSLSYFLEWKFAVQESFCCITLSLIFFANSDSLNFSKISSILSSSHFSNYFITTILIPFFFKEFMDPKYLPLNLENFILFSSTSVDLQNFKCILSWISFFS